MLTTLLAMTALSVADLPRGCSKLVSMTGLPAFPASGLQTFTLPPADPGMPWNEAIVSWNVQGAGGARLTIEGRVLKENRRTKWFTIAKWTGDTVRAVSESVNDQGDDDGEMLTDTLRLKEPGGKLELRLTLETLYAEKVPHLKLLAVSFADTSAQPQTRPPNEKAWGKVIEVPRRSQMPYDGNKMAMSPTAASEPFRAWLPSVKTSPFCSPTACSMILAHWAKELKLPEVDRDVPQVIVGVFDNAWRGTGNWAFNTAYIGSVAGLRSYVTRLESITDLEDLIVAGVPVITSVASNLLQGNGKPAGEDGHLVVLVGFDKKGDPVFNDPGWTTDIRQTYRRENFSKAWAVSNRTVYLSYPESRGLPASPTGCWISE
jgi:hypothetical protein